MKKHLLNVAVACAVILVPFARVCAADATWSTNLGGNWSSGVNWSGGSAPGATGTTNNADTATFGTNITAARTVTNDLSYNIGSIVFSNSSAFGYTLTSNSLLLSSGGWILEAGTGSAHTDTVASAVVIQGDGGTASFLNNSSGSTLAVSGGVTGVSTSGKTTTLTLGGTTIGVTNTISGVIGNGTNGGSLALVKTGAGIWSLSAPNTFSGGVTVLEGTLRAANNLNGAFGTGVLTLGASSGTNSATLDLNANAANLVIAQAGTSNNVLVVTNSSTGSTRQLSGGVVLYRDTVFGTAAGSATQISGGGSNTLAGAANLIKTGAGTLQMSANQSADRQYSGAIIIQEGTFNAVDGNRFARSRLQLDTNTTFLNSSTGSAPIFAGVDGSGLIDNSRTNTAYDFTLSGAGNFVFTGNITNSSTNAATTVNLVVNLEGVNSSQTLSGAVNTRGALTMRSGTLVLDYSNNNAAKLTSTNALNFAGGTLDLRGGSGADAPGSTMVTNAQSFLKRTDGSKTLNLGAITVVGGSLDIASAGIATTTTTNTNNGILGNSARITVGGQDWAANDGSSNIVAYTGYSNWTNNMTGSNATHYLVSGSASGTNNVAVRTLKIATTGAGQSLDLSNKSLTVGTTSLDGGILFTGSDDYTITAASIAGPAGATNTSLLNYGAGKLTLNAGLTNSAQFGHYGTGYTVLAKNAVARAGLWLAGGTVEFSSNAQLGTDALGSLSIIGGRAMANTTGGNIALSNASGWRPVSFGPNNPALEVMGSGTLTIGGVISSPTGMGDSPITIGSSSNNLGTVAITGTANTFIGDVEIAGGTVSLSHSNNLGNSNNWIVFKGGGGTVQSTASFTNARVVNIRAGATGAFAPDAGTVLTINDDRTLSSYAVVRGEGDLVMKGAGALVLDGTNTYTGKTIISSGTLVVGARGRIDYTSEVNLGTTNSPGILDLTANNSFSFGANQKISGNGAINIGTGKTVTVAGILAPGNSPGIITNTGNLTLDSTATIVMELGAGAPGIGYDQLQVSGMLTYDGALTIDGLSGYDITTQTNYTLFTFGSYGGNFDSVSVGGFGLNNSLAGAWVGTNNNTIYTFTLGTGVLDAATVPEPSTCALLGLGGLALAAYRLRRRGR